MSKQTSTSLSHLKKSLLGVAVLSAVTGGLVLLEEYRSTKQASAYSTYLSSYKVPAHNNEQGSQQVIFFKRATDNSLLTTDANELAAIAEQNLLEEAYTVAQHNAADNFKVQNQSKDQFQAKAKAKSKPSPTAMVIEPTTVKTETTNVLFALSSSKIAPEYKLALLDTVDLIKQQPKLKKWQVIGHTDKSGRASYNLSLAHKRAENVANYLIEHGVEKQQLVLVTLGEYEAMKLKESTYNKGLRKVQVSPYAPGLDKLAVNVKRQTDKVEQRLALIKLAKIKKAQARETQQAIIHETEAAVSAVNYANTKVTAHSQVLIPSKVKQNNEVVQVNTELVLNDFVSFNNDHNEQQNINVNANKEGSIPAENEALNSQSELSQQASFNDVMIPSQRDIKNVTKDQQNTQIKAIEEPLITMLSYQL
ncbi:OmpA family protein [uncultured Psychromonas sp.]|uniref:OmpA family protein n=1 Tax=uncultured Psychromonas sp. TaxID=173974 RepID=UPI0026295AA7|nr:OmpA family protein [uncultured Psychromonas sp.]